MVEFRRIQVSLFLILMLQFPATAGQSSSSSSSVTVRYGDDVMLPCGDVISDQSKCVRTNWLYRRSRNSAAVLLNKSNVKPKPDRLSVTENCTLLLKKVTVEDVGVYTCRQFIIDQQQTRDTVVFDLSVVTITGRYDSIGVTDGDDVTLPCGNVIEDEGKCDNTTWIFSNSKVNSVVVALFEDGQINKDTNSKPDRLRVTEKCSLVIKKVTHEDAGVYTCRQFISGQQHDGETVVDLSVVSKFSSSPETEHKNSDEVTLTCSVLTYDLCRLTVKWLNEGKYSSVMETAQHSCFATVTLTTSELHQRSDDLLKCEVTDGDGRKQQFTFRRQSSGDHTDEATTTLTTTATMTTTTTTSPVRDVTNKTFTISGDLTKPAGSHGGWFSLIAVGLAAALLIGCFIRWRKNKRHRAEDTVDETYPAPGAIILRTYQDSRVG